MYLIYVLYSKKHNKIYIGQTVDLIKRFEEHNSSGLSSNSYTKRYIPWEVIYKEEYNTRPESLRREKQLKSQKGREFIWNLIKGKMVSN
jgi:putative endonuclease